MRRRQWYERPNAVGQGLNIPPLANHYRSGVVLPAIIGNRRQVPAALLEST